MLERWEVTLPRLSGDKPRRAYCYLPVGYKESDERYPVIYMFDGHNLFNDEEATFGTSWGLLKYLDETKTKVIIAAVECNHEGDSRLQEYSPVDFSFRGKKLKGRGKAYMDWLVGEFKPYIDSTFKTLPDRANTAIGGSSMGGLMALYALCKYNKIFSKCAALSPSLWVYGGEVPAFLNGNLNKNTTVYMDYGSKEFVNHEVQKEVFGATAKRLIERDIAVTARVVSGGTHSEKSWKNQVPLFMRVLGFLPEYP